MEKKLGKISKARFGLGGYNDACIGLFLQFEGNGWGVQTSDSIFDPVIIQNTEHCKWTESERSEAFAGIMNRLSKTLNEAKKDSVEKLAGTPVEVGFEGNIIKSWRILVEVI